MQEQASLQGSEKGPHRGFRGKFRLFLKNNGWLKKVPTILTICNSLCGFAAILYTLHVYNDESADPAHVLAISAWIILAAMIFDALDGFAARIFNAASIHGLQMDSLSDMVTFGVAPSVLVAIMAHRLRELRSADFYIIWSFCAIYIACAANRLAKYNVHAMLEKKSSEKFTGLPSPGAAAGVCSLVIYYSISTKELRQILYILPVYAAVLGILMVSNIRYVHFGKWLQSARRNRSRMLIILAFLILLFFHFSLVTVIAINGYILSGPISEYFIRRKERQDLAGDTESAEMKT